MVNLLRWIVSDSYIFSFFDMNRKIFTKRKVLFKISVDSNLTFTSNAWLSGLVLFHLDYSVQLIVVDKNFMWKMLLFYTEMIPANFFGDLCFLEESYK